MILHSILINLLPKESNYIQYLIKRSEMVSYRLRATTHKKIALNVCEQQRKSNRKSQVG